ncbi:MAG: hypothetical protein ACYSYT_01280 [Planctomycetota bacterium]|jgi:hypothetical protein
MIMRKMLKSKPKGSVLLLVAAALILLFLTGMGIMSLGLRSRLQAIRTASDGNYESRASQPSPGDSHSF